MFTFLIVVVAAIIFEYSNGFHDAANAIATVVSTKVLTPRQAIAMAGFFNLTGALLGGAVASTIGKGLVDTNVVTMPTVLAAVVAAFAWNITTWWFGLPSSSSHALIGGLCGAALATARGDWSVIKWNAGIWPKVVVPMITSPLAGFIFGGLLMFLLFARFITSRRTSSTRCLASCKFLAQRGWHIVMDRMTRKRQWVSLHSRFLPAPTLAASITCPAGWLF